MSLKEFLFFVATDQKKGPLVFLLKIVLLLLSFVYGVGLSVMKIFYQFGLLRKQRLSRPVISVGNITLGGVGKTPIVESIAKNFIEKGKKPVILMRGYMDQSSLSGKNPKELIESDEAKMLKESLGDIPVLVGSNRYQKAKQYLDAGNPVDIFILDDGFQHWKLHRDLEIVAIDCMNPFGNGRLLPRGILREPVRALQRADVIFLTKVSLSDQSSANILGSIKHFEEKIIVESDHMPQGLIDLRTKKMVDVSTIEEKSVCSFCAIGNPGSFLKSLSSLKARVEKQFSFMDHHVYNDQDIKKIINYCNNNSISIIICTIKDLVKIEKLNFDLPEKINLYGLKIALEIAQGKDSFVERVDAVLHP